MNVPVANIRKGLRAMVKTVGTELIVKTTLAALMSISIVSSGAVNSVLPCWARNPRLLHLLAAGMSCPNRCTIPDPDGLTRLLCPWTTA